MCAVHGRPLRTERKCNNERKETREIGEYVYVGRVIIESVICSISLWSGRVRLHGQPKKKDTIGNRLAANESSEPVASSLPSPPTPRSPRLASQHS